MRVLFIGPTILFHIHGLQERLNNLYAWKSRGKKSKSVSDIKYAIALTSKMCLMFWDASLFELKRQERDFTFIEC